MGILFFNKDKKERLEKELKALRKEALDTETSLNESQKYVRKGKRSLAQMQKRIAEIENLLS